MSDLPCVVLCSNCHHLYQNYDEGTMLIYCCALRGCLPCTSLFIDSLDTSIDEGRLLENAVSSHNLELVKYIIDYQREGIYPFNPFISNAFVNAIDDKSIEIVDFFLSKYERFAPEDTGERKG